jgi:hypothetical protein
LATGIGRGGVSLGRIQHFVARATVLGCWRIILGDLGWLLFRRRSGGRWPVGVHFLGALGLLFIRRFRPTATGLEEAKRGDQHGSQPCLWQHFHRAYLAKQGSGDCLVPKKKRATCGSAE